MAESALLQDVIRFPAAVLEELHVLLDALRITALEPRHASISLTMSRPSATRDFAVCVIFVLVFFVLSWGLRFLMEPMLHTRHPTLRKPVVQKFSQSVTEILTYGSFAVLGLVVVPQQEWSWPSASWWVAGDVAELEEKFQNFPAVGGAKPGFDFQAHGAMRADLRCYYILYAARYIQCGISVLLEHKRKDFTEMFIHHWVTVALCVLSYFYGWNRVGSVIMVLLDPADVPLHLAKICKYLQKARCKRQAFWGQAADILFVVFAIVFFITRLVCYPYVCWSCHIESERYITKHLEWYAVGLLYVLMMLQIYWFGLLLRVAMKLLTTGQAEDVRSDDEDEGTHDNKAAETPILLTQRRRKSVTTVKAA
eukprot:TRINITY_DN44786_c0_g1_i1.p1 TRINITY_DN44786_c0_g1~~TRINITY_DN44786_c0_g1_i1.p1  ORF type:complete len:367 (+),score=54.25 TRINITY_DN44786_c0_g1_i1:70-1170(+)